MVSSLSLLKYNMCATKYVNYFIAYMAMLPLFSLHPIANFSDRLLA